MQYSKVDSIEKYFTFIGQMSRDGFVFIFVSKIVNYMCKEFNPVYKKKKD